MKDSNAQQAAPLELEEALPRETAEVKGAQPARSSDQRRLPKQTRGIETWNAILQAAADLYAEQGFEPTTTHQIAAQAGVSVGALYRYFGSKQAILKELYCREISGLRNRLFEEFRLVDLVGQDVRSLVRKTLALAFRVYRERPGLRRVLGEQSRKIPELIELRQRQEQEFRQAVQQLIAAVPGVAIADVEVTAYLLILLMESLIDDHIVYRGAAVRFADERVVDAACELILQAALGKPAR